MLEREIRSSWGANLAWFGRPSWGQVAAKLPGSRPKSALVSGLDSEPGSELPFATPVDQIEPGSIDLNPLNLVSCLDSEPGSELPFATPVEQIEPGSIEFSLLQGLRLIREFNV